MCFVRAESWRSCIPVLFCWDVTEMRLGLSVDHIRVSSADNKQSAGELLHVAMS